MTSFQEIVREKVPFLRRNQELFNSLKQSFFLIKKKSKPFKRPLFLRKQEKGLNDDFHHIYKYSQVPNTKTICLFELFQKHSF